MKSTTKIDITNYIYILLMIAVFMLSSLQAQSFLKPEISIVEFNSNWNKANHFGLDGIKNCKIFDVSICDNPKYMDKFNITTPSIVIYHNGLEVKRYQSNILFTFDVTHKNLQQDVDSLLLTKFN